MSRRDDDARRFFVKPRNRQHKLTSTVLVQPDGWARGEREGDGEPCDVTSLSLVTLAREVVQDPTL